MNFFLNKSSELIENIFCSRKNKINDYNSNKFLNNTDWELLLILDKSLPKSEEKNKLSISILNYLLNDQIIKNIYKKIINLEENSFIIENINQQNIELNKIINRILILEKNLNSYIDKMIFNSIQKSNDNELCCICLNNIKNYAYINCGHLCICENCKNNIKNEKWQNQCPICKKNGKSIKIWR